MLIIQISPPKFDTIHKFLNELYDVIIPVSSLKQPSTQIYVKLFKDIITSKTFVKMYGKTLHPHQEQISHHEIAQIIKNFLLCAGYEDADKFLNPVFFYHFDSQATTVFKKVMGALIRIGKFVSDFFPLAEMIDDEIKKESRNQTVLYWFWVGEAVNFLKILNFLRFISCLNS